MRLNCKAIGSPCDSVTALELSHSGPRASHSNRIQPAAIGPRVFPCPPAPAAPRCERRARPQAPPTWRAADYGGTAQYRPRKSGRDPLHGRVDLATTEQLFGEPGCWRSITPASHAWASCEAAPEIHLPRRMLRCFLYGVSLPPWCPRVSNISCNRGLRWRYTQPEIYGH